MSNKNIQAHMQIDVSFTSDIKRLTKELESSIKGVNLSSTLTKGISTDLSKGIKEIYSNLDKMEVGLSKKGLNAKQYTTIFNNINEKLRQSTGFAKDLKKQMRDVFESSENKQAIKDLENFKKQLAEINKLASLSQAALTRQDTSKRKLRDELGIDYDASKRVLNDMSKRYSNRQEFSDGQKDWITYMELDEAKLKRTLTLVKQINDQNKKHIEFNSKAKDITGQSNLKQSEAFLKKNIANLEEKVFTQSVFKENLSAVKEVEKLDKEVNKAAFDLDSKFTPALNAAEVEAKKAAQASSTVREIFAQFGIAFSAATIVRGFQNLARGSFEFYKSLDSALNEIYVVSNLSSDAVNGLQGKFINMAKNTGMALDDVTRSAVLFYQQGLNTAEVMEMTKVTSEFAKVAGIDATDAADKLTAAVNGYCLSAGDASRVADKFNKVAAVTAADINELSTAFSKAAAQANQAGVSMDNYLAYIATMEEVTREAPENIGTSLKTIFSRMQQIKTGNNTEDTTDVNQVETALKSVGIALRDTQGQLRDLEEIFDELGPKWNSLDRNTQAYLGTIIAGTRQQSRFITLMQNWDRVLEVSEQSANSAGMQAWMHAKAMDSITSKMQQFQVAWQEFVSNLASSDFFKTAIKGLTELLKLVNSGNKPMIILAGSLALVTKRLGDLIHEGAKNKLKDFAEFFKTGFKNTGEKNSALMNNQAEQKANKTMIDANLEYEKTLQEQIFALQVRRQEVGHLTNEETEKLINLELEQKNIQNQINAGKERGLELTKEEERIKNSPTKKGAILQGAGAAVSTAGMATNDANLSGLLGSTGSLLMAAGASNPISAITMGITAFIQFKKTMDNWTENLKKKITDAVEQTGTKLEDINTKGTVIRSSNKLIEKYEHLSKKIVRTSAEQEQLNNAVQELGDLHSVDVIADEYGNLAIDINEVKKKVEELNEERKKGIEELRQEELKAIDSATSGLLNTNSINDYYDELFASIGSKYRDLLEDMDDGLTKETRAVSESLSKTLMSNIKNQLVEDAKKHPGSYIESGIGAGLVKNQEVFKNLDSEAWNDLYAEVGSIKENLDSMTFNEVQARMEKFYDSWAEENNITGESLEALKRSINDTFYGNSNIMEYYNKINSLEDKSNGTYFEKEKEQLESLIKLNKKKTAEIRKDWYALALSMGPLGPPLVGMVEMELHAKNASTRAADKRLKEIRKEEEKVYEEIAKQHGWLKDEGGYDIKGAEEWLSAQIKIRDSLQQTTVKTQDFITAIKSFSDFDGLGPEQAKQVSQMLNDIIPQLEQENDQKGKANLFTRLVNQWIDNIDDTAIKEKLQNMIDDSFNNLELPQGYTYTQIADSLDTISEKLISMNDLVATFNENGALTLDEFKELGGILDSFNPEELYAISDLDNGVNYVNDYIDALHRLDLAYDANSGMITMNGEALNDLRAIQEAQAQAQITTLRNELVAKKTQVEAEIGYIDAQIAGTEAAISAIEANSKAKMTGQEIIDKADKATSESFKDTIDTLQKNYATDVQNMNTWTQAVLGDLSTATEAWGRYWKATAGEYDGNLDDLRKEAEKKTKSVKWETSKAGVDKDKTYNRAELDALANSLGGYKSKLENLKTKYQGTLEIYNSQINLLDSMKGADLSKLGKGAGSGSGSSEKLTQYIGKLKEIFNILNRIQVLEHRLGTLDAYADIAQGQRYGNLLKERLSYNEELLDQYEFLTREQKQFTNGYKDFIQSVDGLQGVFDFDQFGQIIINWDKYTSLQDTAIGNETTLKEKADDVYDTYTKMFTDLHGYFDKTIDYYKQVIALQEEMVDNYISIQNEVADAVKEIYQKILDTKLDAIDKEKDALDELKKARDRANKDAKNAEAVSNLQTNLQRNMMDTSGASDVAFLKSQKDIENKLGEIAEDKYSTMLSDIQDKLDEEKDALQKAFDDMFDQLDWLFSWIDADIMGDESAIYSILQQTDEWNQSSFLERQKMLDTWSTQFHSYYKSMLENNRGIYGIYDNINTTRERIGVLDNNLKQYISKGSAEITQTILKWQDGVSGAINNLSSRISSIGAGGGGVGGTPSGISSNPSASNTNITAGTTKETWSVEFYSDGKKVGEKTAKVGSSITISHSVSKTGYTLSGWTVDGKLYDSYTSMVPRKMRADAVWKKKSSSVSSNPTKSQLLSGPRVGFDTGGLADFTGPAWLDGTKQSPEMVLNQLQTKHFIDFVDTMDKMYSGVNTGGGGLNSSVTIGSIGFQVDSMSSPEDGERAFNMFVEKFKEIGSQTGLKVNSFKNTL